MDLHHVVIDHGDVTNVQAIGIQETMEGLSVIKFLDLGFVEALAKLAPHGIEHHFGQGTQPRILLNLVVLQPDAFLFEIVVYISLFVLFSHVLLRPPTRFLFDF